MLFAPRLAPRLCEIVLDLRGHLKDRYSRDEDASLWTEEFSRIWLRGYGLRPIGSQSVLQGVAAPDMRVPDVERCSDRTLRTLTVRSKIVGVVNFARTRYVGTQVLELLLVGYGVGPFMPADLTGIGAPIPRSPAPLENRS